MVLVMMSARAALVHAAAANVMDRAKLEMER
jgi:hypothetical protein